MIKVGNVWYLRSQQKEAENAFYWLQRARKTELWKMRTYGRSSFRNGRSGPVKKDCGSLFRSR